MVYGGTSRDEYIYREREREKLRVMGKLTGTMWRHLDDGTAGNSTKAGAPSTNAF